MSAGTLFWILMLLGLIFGFWHWRGRAGPYGPVEINLFLFIILALLDGRCLARPYAKS